MDGKQAFAEFGRFWSQLTGIFPNIAKLPEMIEAIESEHNNLPMVRAEHTALTREIQVLTQTKTRLADSIPALEAQVSSFRDTLQGQKRELTAERERLEAEITATREEFNRVKTAFDAFKAEHGLTR